jgi:hypothetical protein
MHIAVGLPDPTLDPDERSLNPGAVSLDGVAGNTGGVNNPVPGVVEHRDQILAR